MATDYLTCPLCGFEFERQDTLCSHGCPLGALCQLLRCPACEYEFPLRPRRPSWVKRLFGKSASRPPLGAEDVVAVCDLRRGARGTVVCLGGDRPSRHNALAVFGIVPGAEVTLIQRQPSCVIRVGETELALDGAIARDVLVKPCDAVAGVAP